MAEAQSDSLRADRPIRSRSEDRLGRSVFAGAVARAVFNWRGDDSLVIGLYGEWGSGKTSVKNLIKECIAAEPEEGRPISVDFNAWEFSGQEQLAEAFFREIGEALGHAGSTQAKTLQSGFKTLARYSGITGRTLAALARFGPLLAPLAGASPAESAIVGVAGATASQAAEQLKALSDDAKAAEELGSTPSVAEAKARIAKLLRDQDRNVIVFVDDVDRLVADEIRLLFRLVKVNADLPRLIYVLLFQRDIVERAIEKDVTSTGREYLAKIIQAGYDLPAIRQQDLVALLIQELDRVVELPPIKKTFDMEAWSSLFPRIQPYFRTARDVCRFTNTIGFQTGAFLRDGSFEVNPVDLIGLHVLSLFEPETYARIPGLKSQLIDDPATMLLRRDDSGEGLKRALERLLEPVREAARGNARRLLEFLFPRIEVLQNRLYGDWIHAKWERERRVCSYRFFDRYFQLALPAGELSQRDMDDVLESVADREALAKTLIRLHVAGLLPAVFERLEAFKEEFPLEHALPLLTALFDVGDLLPKGRKQWLETDSAMHALRIVYWFLKRETSAERKEEILRAAMQQTLGVYLPAYVVLADEPSKDGRDSQYEVMIRDESRAEFQKLCVGKIEAAAAGGALRLNVHVGELLSDWNEWGDAENARKWVADLTETTEGALIFLRGLVLDGFSSRHRPSHVPYMHITQVEEFIPSDVIEERLKDLDITALSDADRTAVNAFRVTLDRRRRGRPDNQPFFMDPEELAKK